MKKKYRDITVDEVKYAWTIIGDGKERYVTIWKDKKEWFSSSLRVTTVTPKDISELIQSRLTWEKLEDERPEYGSLQRIGKEQEKIEKYGRLHKGRS